MTGPVRQDEFDLDVVVIGGCGHVGLPLAIALADRGARVGIYDVSEAAVEAVNSRRMPFAEPGAEDVLERVSAAGRLRASASAEIVGRAEHVIVVIGTPVDAHLNPDQGAVPKALGGCTEYLRAGQILILRSTVYPGVTAKVEKMIAGLGMDIDVAFCPERIAEGKAMTELFDAAADSLVPHPARHGAGQQAIRTADHQARGDVAGGGGAGEAITPMSGGTSSSPPRTSFT